MRAAAASGFTVHSKLGTNRSIRLTRSCSTRALSMRQTRKIASRTTATTPISTRRTPRR